MTKIELLMRELNLTDTLINQTLYKINTICSKYGYTEFNTTNNCLINGNGDGNGGDN